uniref:Uncharacterized protein n=1 Tax=Chromera velia CCMP2878 TaxID=1169474 RepID=A0A0G4G9X9_9ALVE|eukprot:Cvel_20879.t1-p1 / transcript=Cvel_20879.t1 / gene=Cvel_20879 / organism=Chromera_velia_CCMP2878 / gene_product=hypothetical protein / transcript_product=hypothetical protein / location=Cvel_scaffold1914:3261-4532(+) / protein_length=254 / sequence_SO=supercontig / SO=protein_coding / is_pseudo=false
MQRQRGYDGYWVCERPAGGDAARRTQRVGKETAETPLSLLSVRVDWSGPPGGGFSGRRSDSLLSPRMARMPSRGGEETKLFQCRRSEAGADPEASAYVGASVSAYLETNENPGSGDPEMREYEHREGGGRRKVIETVTERGWGKPTTVSAGDRNVLGSLTTAKAGHAGGRGGSPIVRVTLEVLQYGTPELSSGGDSPNSAENIQRPFTAVETEEEDVRGRRQAMAYETSAVFGVTVTFDSPDTAEKGARVSTSN